MSLAYRIQEYLDRWGMRGEWDVFRPERTRDILPMVLQEVQGDILEIGAHVGGTTKIFCDIGKEYNRQVYVIDPWDGRQEGDDGAYNSFVANTAGLTNLTVHRMGSERQEVLTLLNGKKFAYILIDGLHGYDAVRNDFLKFRELLNDGGVICVDDWNGPYEFCGNIQRAVLDNLTQQYQLLKVRNFIENYIIKVQYGQ